MSNHEVSPTAAAELLASIRSQATTNHFQHADDAAFMEERDLTAAGKYQIRERILIERAVIRKAVSDLIAEGYAIQVHNGEELAVNGTRDAATVMAAIMQTDEDRLYLLNVEGPAYAPKMTRAGWVHLVYGNDGWDVVSDYTTNLGNALTGAGDLADALGEAL
ncbi:hypothetical protein [Stenotrophomonas maltophilia]|uniref:hypothetical protein n=1 Tax=Stenotrophomonas maltophilia TaxID=40324 RepID=UPI0021C937F3|nr:hypothetical protein [Stenotrophomonas maltophilia]